MRLSFILALVFLGGTAAGCAAVTSNVSAPRPRVVGYYYGPTAQRGFPPSRIDARLLTHLIYAFGNVGPDGTVTLGSPALDSANFVDLRRLKQRSPHLQILIAFGGWGGSKHFSDAVATPENRARFISSTLDVFLRRYRDVFDGVDLDWEYPTGGGMEGNSARPEDRENLTALATELRRALDAEGRTAKKKYLITMATPAGEGQLQKYEMKRLGQLLDFINVMTYDFHTAGKTTHFNAPLAAAKDDPSPNLNVQSTVAAYVAAGVPKNKIIVGVPFYGYGYGGVVAANNGRFQPVKQIDKADRPKYIGSVRFYDIAKALSEGFQRHWDEDARVPWLYNPATQVWISYDDAQSLGEKADYVRKEKLGGIMIWELSGDNGTLLPEIYQRLNR